MLAISYARVSTEEQYKQGYSLESQLEACRARASSLNIPEEDMVELVEDEGVTGAILERPKLSMAREMIRQGGVKYFICLEPDRFSRDFSNQLIIAKEIKRAGVQLEFTKFKFEDTPEGRFFFNILGTVAELEKDQIRERTMRGKRQKAKQGKIPHYLRMYGYRLEHDELIIEPMEQSIYNKTLEWADPLGSDEGCRTIRRKLNDMGIPSATGKRWCDSAVLRMLRNPAPVTGELIVNKWDSAGESLNRHRKQEDKARRHKRPEEERITIKIPKLTEDKARWDRVQENLDRARRLHCGYARHEYLLSGLLKCGLCGGGMRGSMIQGRYQYYVCRKVKDPIEGKCSLSYIPVAKLEEEVWARVCQWIDNPKLLFEELNSDMSPSRENELQETEILLNAAVKERTRLIDLAQKGLVPPQEIETRLKEVKSRIDKLTARQNHLQIKQGPKLADIEFSTTKWKSDLETSSFIKRKEVVRNFVEKIVVYPDRAEIKPRFLS